MCFSIREVLSEAASKTVSDENATAPECALKRLFADKMCRMTALKLYKCRNFFAEYGWNRGECIFLHPSADICVGVNFCFIFTERNE